MHPCDSQTGLNAGQIKLLAIAAMTLDHLLWLLFPGCRYDWWIVALHAIGRITAPIMWFFLAEGFHYTHNRARYAGRLFLFAVLSHFAYDFAGGISFLPTGIFNQTSVMWSLAWSVVLMSCYERSACPMWLKLVFTAFVCGVTFPSDWSCIAAMCPVFLHAHRGNFRRQALDIVIWTGFYAVVYVLAIDPVYGLLQMCTALSIPILARYNGRRGTIPHMKWLFYVYYPAHLAVIGLLRVMRGGGSIFPC